MNKLMFAGLALAAVLVVNTSSAFAGTAAENMKACGVQWQQLKADNKVAAGATWPSFEKECLAKMEAAAAVPAAPAVKVAAPAAPAAPVAKMAAPAVVPASAAMAAANDKNCTDQWAQMSTLKKVASGATADTFKAGCLAKLQAAAPAAKMVAPAAAVAPAAVAPAAKGAAPAAAATGGMPAEQSRIKICAKQWDDMKAAKTTPVDLKWPQFWHQCDVKLKAAGQ